MSKIRNLETLGFEGRVLCHGCFDFLHLGHVRYFQRAAELGVPLIVTVTADEFVNKGPRRPYFNHDQRAEMIAALECVDYVAISHYPHATQAINIIKPHIYCKGVEYKAHGTLALEEEAAAVLEHGGRVVFIDNDGKQFSSTQILKEWDGT